jgi:molybdopterin converting factor small subunit
MVDTWGEALRAYLFDPQTLELFPHIRVMVSGRDIGLLDVLQTVLTADDKILVLPTVGGG